MAKIRANVGFGEASDYNAVEVELDADEVQPVWIPAVTREVPAEVDGDDGQSVTKTEVVTPGRMESLEDALRRELAGYITVDEVSREGIERLYFTVEYSGQVELEFTGSDLEFLEESNPEDLTHQEVYDAFEDAIKEAVYEDIGYNGSVEVVDFEAE